MSFWEEITKMLLDESIENDYFDQFNNADIDSNLYLKSSFDLANFWLSYLTMVQSLVNTLYDTSTTN